MSNLLQDLRYSLRMLRRAPGMVAVIVSSLALGIGANTAVFSFVNAIQFKPLPVLDEDRLVDLSETSATELCAGCAVGTSYPSFLDWKTRARSFSLMAAYSEDRVVIGADRAGSRSGGLQQGDAGGVQPERVGGAAVSADLFRLIGVQPAIGRDFQAADDRVGAEPVTLISDLLWRRRLAADPQVLGRPIKINGVTHTVIGVMPVGFRFPEYAQLWRPLAPAAVGWARDNRSLAVIARLRDGATIDSARAEMRTLAAAQEAEYPATNRRWTATAVSLRKDMTGETAMASTVLLAAVAFVLLIACANVANLLLVGAVARRRETAIRLALGAKPSRVIRLLVTESLVLAVIGGGLGLLIAFWASGVVVASFGVDAPYWIQFGIDWRVLLFCAAITTLAGASCGIVPALQASRADLHGALKEGGAVAGGRGGRRFRHAMVIGQLALALLLLSGAGLLIKTATRAWSFDVGYDTSRVVVADVDLAGRRYEDPAQVTAFVAGVLERLQRLPGVQAAISRTVFFRGFGATERRISVEGMPDVPQDGSPSFYYAVTPAYFQALGVSLRDGRGFSSADVSVAVVNQEMARRIWPGRSPLGQRIRFGDASSRAPWLTVIGVVADSGGSPFGAGQRSVAYVPLSVDPGRSLSVTISAANPSALPAEVRGAVHAVDPDQPVEDVMTMEQAMERWVAPARFMALLMSGLAAIALLLASIGTYGVIAYNVGQRTREIGIRLALGASARQVQAMVADSGLRMTLGGLAIGLPAAWVSTRALEGILAGTSPTDPAVFAAVTATLGASALAASWLPARRAGKVDPMVVLRVE
jgi:putative ABC transport system permease protein